MGKEMKLRMLSLKNFKGIQEFVLIANESNVQVFGDNAVGKTSLFDGFNWLLFDKDSQNKKDFQLKTVNQNGQELHGLEHEVEGAFLVDGQELTLRKVFSEKWTKKRGSATKEFTGHTTDYYINGVPSKKKEYTDKVSSIVDEDVFKLLTSPAYFNEQLHWQKRREILLEICGDISDDDVIASNKALAKLPDVLSNKSIEDIRKIIASKRAEINKELDRIPVRIDEVQRSIPDVSKLDEKQIDTDIANKKSLIESKEAEISRIQNGAEVSHKEKELREIEIELIDMKNQHQSKNHELVNEKRKELHPLQEQKYQIEHELNMTSHELSQKQHKIKELAESTEKLRTEWREVNGQTFEFKHDTDCPCCGQALPADQIQSAKDKALADFNTRKSEKLEQINARGKAQAKELEETKKAIASAEQEIATLEKQLNKKQQELEQKEKEVQALQSDVSDIEEDPAYQSKKAKAETIKQDIDKLKSTTDEAVSKVRNEIASLKESLESLEADKAKFVRVKDSDQRMKELSEIEKKLATEFEKLEQQLYLTEEFIRTKVQMLEEKINSKFKYARFKLFQTNINGGLEEKCETLYGGVPYSQGLNNAARINVGLDIINTLSEHYGFQAPIFVDNAEAVTKLIDVNTQVIKLVVSEGDKELRVVN